MKEKFINTIIFILTLASASFSFLGIEKAKAQSGEMEGSSGGGDSTVTSGTTVSSGCTDKYALWSDSNTVKCVAGSSNVIIPAGTAGITLSGPTAVRALTIPDAAGTIPFIGSQQTWTTQQILISNIGWILGSNNTGTHNTMWMRASLTPDAGVLSVGSTSNSWHVNEGLDVNFDFNNGPCGTSACTNPQFIVHDKDQDVAQYQSLGLSGISGRFEKTLTESAATDIVSIPGTFAIGQSGQLLYTVMAADATDQQVRSGRVLYNIQSNEAGTTACIIGTPEELDNTPTGTLTATITCNVVGTTATLQINAVSSLAQTTLKAYAQLLHVGAGEPLPQ